MPQESGKEPAGCSVQLGREWGEDSSVHEVRTNTRLVRVGSQSEAWSISADRPWPRQTQAGWHPFPLIFALDPHLGPSILLGQQEGVGVTCRQVSIPL